MNNNILDYEQAQEKSQNIVTKGTIKQEIPLAITKYGLPIEHYTIGTGKADIVITGSTHGSEIISTDFIIQLMENISKNPSAWEGIMKEFQIHFIPMLNPEGYLISTSAVRKLIPRNMSQEMAESICKTYYKLYKEDDTNPDTINNIKRHQEMFSGIDYTCIPEKYKYLREHIKSIFEKYPDLPKWCLHIWSANGNGIDIQANSKYNPANAKIINNEPLYMATTRHNNIDISHPGPINCPFDKEQGFKTEIETDAISNLLESLNKQGRLFAYLNYHSTGGMIYQRPAINPSEQLNITKSDLSKKEIVNYMFAKLYSDKTYKNTGIDTDGIDKKEKTKYIIKTGTSQATSSNDIFRLLYPQNLLIELSGMGGNPIAPYGDIKGNYTNAIHSNLNAIHYTLQVASVANVISDYLYNKIQTLHGEKKYEHISKLIDLVYNEFSKKVELMMPKATKNYNFNNSITNVKTNPMVNTTNSIAHNNVINSINNKNNVHNNKEKNIGDD